MSGCWRRLRQRSERELPERAALFLRAAHRREELPRAARGGWQRLLALHGVKGVFSFRREYPLLIPQRKARGVPLDPRIAGLGLEELHALRNRVPAKCCCKTIWSTPPTRCRSACVSAAFCNFRLLRMLSALQVPTGAALLRSPRLFAPSVEGGEIVLAAAGITGNVCISIEGN